jgi:protein-histidine pros-kinase
MKLIVKFNLVLLLVFAIGFIAAGYVSNRLLLRNANQEILENARIMMEAALAVRTYTNNQIKPLLDTQLKYSFLPQSVPAYSANEYFKQLRNKFPDYSYKEATLNPTNPINRATDWEADIVRYFRQSPEKTELIGERDTPNGRALYIARPMKIKDAKCLYCHDTPERAPRTMIERYGSDNGFGWKLNDILTAQIVSAPMQLPIRRAKIAFAGFMLSLAGVFVGIFLALNAMLIFLVTRRVNRLSKLADEVSLGNMGAPEFQVSGKDEIAELAESFGRMRKSLAQAIKMLDSDSKVTSSPESRPR